jgi:hypothetical protein
MRRKASERASERQIGKRTEKWRKRRARGKGERGRGAGKGEGGRGRGQESRRQDEMALGVDPLPRIIDNSD